MTRERTSGLATEVRFLKGVGPKGAALLEKIGLRTVEDVLWHLPRRYEDRRDAPQIMLLRPGRSSTVIGKLEIVRSRGIGRGRVIVEALVSDETGEIVLCFFNQPWVGRQLEKYTGQRVVAYGSVKEGYRRRLELHGVEWEPAEDDVDAFARIVPVYALSEGVPQRLVRAAAAAAVGQFGNDVPDPLPHTFRKQHGLPLSSEALTELHHPTSDEARIRARRRFAFEEFLYLQIALQVRRQEIKQEVGISFPIRSLGKSRASAGTLFEPETGSPLSEEVAALFPFELTEAQNRVIQHVWRDMEAAAPMNRLVQGDVGSGKTAVAAAAMLAAVRCGWQAAMMAPTEILAEQHYFNLKKVFDPRGIPVVLLAGKLGARDRKSALAKAENGEGRILVGTHALIQEGVKFHSLGLIVIDEQHRFGVAQRMALRQKGETLPDVLVMTATPIPRSFTMTMYGDLDVSVLDELPPGRSPVTTYWRRPGDRSKVYSQVEELLATGAQAYFVCPMISENEKIQAQAAEDLHYRLSTGVFAHRKVGLLHGQMKAQEKEAVMEAFRAGETAILVATVVIEVGVDVPNASVMVVEDANRFGLAQLHQLRGRVGRGARRSFCILISEGTSDDVVERMQTLVDTTDGFVIAEKDLRLRGPGDLMGTQQHGLLTFQVADLVKDAILLEEAREAARLLVANGELDRPEWAMVVERTRARRGDEALVTVS
ncbi:MAG: ATP-dependent DNA helicase RecG [Fimbriimonadaceae bacterium]|nr:ATP-dependent DNA helicase RecG [Fimbriimonadaceae bacterium]